MLFSRTHEYTLQALIHLAVHRDEWTLGREVAAHLGVPGPYLAKILKELASRGLVESAKGRGGGFRVAPRVLRMRIVDVLDEAAGHDVFAGCVLGLKTCSDATACPVHAEWQPLKARLLALFGRHTVGSMAAEVREGRYRIGLPQPVRRRSRRES